MYRESTILFVTFFLITFLFAVNSQSEETSVRLKDFVGVWKPVASGKDHSLVIRFDGDGSFRMAWKVNELDTRPIDKGQIKLEGKQVTVYSTESLTCNNGTGRYTIAMMEKGRFRFGVKDDQCVARRSFFAPQWIQIN